MQGFDTLRLLNLEDNHIVSWYEMVKLSYLRRYKYKNLTFVLKLVLLQEFFHLDLVTCSLEQLHLNKNKIKHVRYPSNLPSSGPLGDVAVPAFEKLQVLLLGIFRACLFVYSRTSQT